LEKNKDRLTHFRRIFHTSDLCKAKLHIVYAVDGKQLELERIVEKKALQELYESEKRGYRYKHHQLTRGAVGCYLSHFEVYRNILESGKEYGFVCEDDAIFPIPMNEYIEDILSKVPRKWDIIVFTSYIHNSLEINNSYQRVYQFWGLHTYIIHREAIYKILKNYDFPIDRHLDALYSLLASKDILTIYAPIQNMTSQEKKLFPSDIHSTFMKIDGMDPFDQEDTST
jgi:GR25 family glycosyltransferase involved in LPS biosynthesis